MYNNFDYENDSLFCDGVSLAELAEQYGTPFYVYSQTQIENNYKAFTESLGDAKHLICYSVKSNSNLSILRLLFGLGAGADIVSGGELYRVLLAGGAPDKIVFSGVGKHEQEIAEALDAGILAFNVESLEELEIISRIASDRGQTANVSLRINPDVDAQSHPYISTGLKENKFGIAATDAAAAYKKAAVLPGVAVNGIDCHIGSQLTNTQPFRDAIALVAETAQGLRDAGMPIEHVDIGGGLGIDYGNDDGVPSVEEYGQTVREVLAPLLAQGLTLVCEPGRAIVGTAGALITKVLYRKRTEVKHFTIVDAGFNDLLRPTLYQGHHPMLPVTKSDAALLETDVVGPVCESGDFLARDRQLPALAQGDLLWVGAAGAYGFAMTSNYNSRPRPPEILCHNGSHQVIRQRETYRDLVAPES